MTSCPHCSRGGVAISTTLVSGPASRGIHPVQQRYFAQRPRMHRSHSQRSKKSPSQCLSSSDMSSPTRSSTSSSNANVDPTKTPSMAFISSCALTEAAPRVGVTASKSWGIDRSPGIKMTPRAHGLRLWMRTLGIKWLEGLVGTPSWRIRIHSQ